MRAWLIALGAAALWACGGGGGGTSPPDGGTTGSGDGGGGGSAGGGASDGGTGGGATDGGSLAAGGGDWAQYRGGVRGTSENPGTFEVGEVANLREVWKTDLGPYVYTQAVIAGDTVYFTTGFSGKIVALNAATGAVRWSRSFDPTVSTACGGAKTPGFWAAPAVVNGVVYVAAPDGHAYALRSDDGATIWSSAIADPTAAGHGEFLQSSPAVSTALGRLYVGIASSDHCDEVRGKIAMVDLATGAAVVKPLVDEGRRGGGIWSSISIDESATPPLVFASTANRVGDIAAEPLAQSIVSFDARTLDVIDHWQNPSTLENSDFGSSPTLFAAADGTPLVAAANKDGWLYVLRRDRLSAGPVWKAQLAVIDPQNPSVGGDPAEGWGSIVSPTFAGGRLYAAGGRTPAGRRTPANKPGSVVAFDPGTGKVVWEHETPGYVIAPMPAVGDILIAESSAPDGSASWLEVLDGRNGAVLRRFDGKFATFAAPSVGRGLILWTDVLGNVTALAAPRHRP